MVSLPASLHNINIKPSGGITKVAGKIGLGGAATALFCLFDFAQVPEAFKLGYNEDGEKIEGINWTAGLKETAKSAVRCASYFVVPAAVLALCPGAGIAGAAVLGGLSFASSFGLSGLNEKILPHETEKIKQACEKKGIKLDQTA